MDLIIYILRALLNVLWWIIVIQAIMSWLIAFNVIPIHNPGVRQIWSGLNQITGPIYAPIRRILPDFGGLDFAPVIVLIVLSIIINRVLIS
jgi:YggT family protein